MQYQKELESALDVTRRAGRLAMRYFAKGITAEEKSDGSPVTAADRECEALISRYLSDTFPSDGILGEEGSSRKTTSGRRWLIDPIDGTRDFVRRTDFWCTQLALQVSDRVMVGVIYFPCLDEIYYAAAGTGCFCNGTRSHLSDVRHLNRSIITVSGFPSVWRMWPENGVRYLTQNCWAVRGYGGCYDIAMLLAGKCDIWLSASGEEWDYAPARILAEESGATFLLRDGSDRINGKHCLICTPALAQELRHVLAIPAIPTS
jgi:histidinol-phosphatase